MRHTALQILFPPHKVVAELSLASAGQMRWLCFALGAGALLIACCPVLPQPSSHIMSHQRCQPACPACPTPRCGSCQIRPAPNTHHGTGLQLFWYWPQQQPSRQTRKTPALCQFQEEHRGPQGEESRTRRIEAPTTHLLRTTSL
jgi:hypothetical protein